MQDVFRKLTLRGTIFENELIEDAEKVLVVHFCAYPVFTVRILPLLLDQIFERLKGKSRYFLDLVLGDCVESPEVEYDVLLV